MRAELHPFFADLAQLVEAEDLKATGIGKHGPRPGDKTVQPSQPPDQLVTRPQVQVIGIGENDLRVQLFEQMLGDGLDRPAVPTGIKAGVWTCPWGSVMVARLACPLTASI